MYLPLLRNFIDRVSKEIDIMPTDVFYNLDKEKRDILFEAAFKEFVEKSFEKVSISKIARVANISRTGMYYYFTDKEDIYLYLIEVFKDNIKKLFVEEGKVEVFEATKRIFEYFCSIKGTAYEAFVLRMLDNLKPHNQRSVFLPTTHIENDEEIFSKISFETVRAEDEKDNNVLWIVLIGMLIMIIREYYLDQNTLEKASHLFFKNLDYIKNGFIKRD